MAMLLRHPEIFDLVKIRCHDDGWASINICTTPWSGFKPKIDFREKRAISETYPEFAGLEYVSIEAVPRLRPLE